MDRKKLDDQLEKLKRVQAAVERPGVTPATVAGSVTVLAGILIGMTNEAIAFAEQFEKMQRAALAKIDPDGKVQRANDRADALSEFASEGDLKPPASPFMSEKRSDGTL